MKPNGLTWDFKVTTSSRVEDKIWEAVQEALLAGWTVDEFRQEARQAWNHELKQRVTEDDKEWDNV